jgi:predicted amidohydrolase YtcJ
VKAFADGSLGAGTALFLDPYADDPASSGLALADLEPAGELERRVLEYCEDLFQPAVHAIGDRANRLVLDLYRRVDRMAGHPFHPPFREFRIEHAQHLHPEDVGRFGRSGVVAVMQPSHLVADGCFAERRLGAKRSRGSYVFRDLLDQGATLAFGSDWPVAPLSPILGIHAAVTRQTHDGKNRGGWLPEQRITAEEALRAYTRGSAHAGLSDVHGGVGVLTVGALADMVVLDTDILEVAPDAIKDVKVDITIVNGRVVYDRGAGTH